MKRPRVQRIESRPNGDGEFLTVELREFDGAQVLTVEHRVRDLDKPTSRSQLIGVEIRVELLSS